VRVTAITWRSATAKGGSQPRLPAPPPRLPADPQTFDFLNLAGPALVLLAAAFALRDEAASRRAAARRSRALLEARRRAAEGLLGRLLPAWAAAELEARPPAEWAARAPDRFEDCVLVQCDLVRESDLLTSEVGGCVAHSAQPHAFTCLWAARAMRVRLLRRSHGGRERAERHRQRKGMIPSL
jgi:hypothetical protein